MEVRILQLVKVFSIGFRLNQQLKPLIPNFLLTALYGKEAPSFSWNKSGSGIHVVVSTCQAASLCIITTIFQASKNQVPNHKLFTWFRFLSSFLAKDQFDISNVISRWKKNQDSSDCLAFFYDRRFISLMYCSLFGDTILRKIKHVSHLLSLFHQLLCFF